MRELICDLPVDERPRERLLRHGADTLSDAELIAILLGSGVPGRNAIQVARELVAGDFHGLATREPTQLASVSGVGDAKAARVVAAFEVARRFANPRREPEQPVVSIMAFGSQLVTRCAHYRQERLGAAFLDSRGRLIREREIFVGSITSCVVSKREVITMAIEERAVKVIVFHNHPSGDSRPSAEDIQFTKHLNSAFDAIEVELVDHLVIGRNGFESMFEKRMY
ncbi:MAG: repair protein RadC [Acidobacteriota bacterium]|jgi:DNA repair protein RadC|nr:repair protein RadC [Acidobacteriota bacterium]